jgi:methionyl-tRNA synthetase
MKPFYITTAIDYTNAPPHIGHAYEKTLADVIARDRRLRGQDVFFLTGVDQHGQKVQQSAAKAGVSEKDFADGLTKKFVALWERLGISYDGWAATTEALHKDCVRKILARLHTEGKIYKASHGGYYSVRQEQFLTDKDRGPDGEFGPEWGEVNFVEEENYYFRLAENKDWLLGLMEKRPHLVTPAFRQLELKNAVEKLTGDLCISRPKSRLAWGIELPFDPDFVTYVWFDALINYISFVGYGADERFDRLWPADYHVIGKDILVPAHGVYWLIMLHAMGFADDAIPNLLVHGYINLGGDKVSKSLGNVVDPMALADKYGAGALRYYLMREAVTGQDMEFSEERLIVRYNSDLANGLGNLLNRTLNMTARYREGLLKRPTSSLLEAAAVEAIRLYDLAFGRNEPHAAMEAASGLVVRCNTYIEETTPWKLAKDPDRAAELDEVLYGLAESLRILAILYTPVLPDASLAMLEQLGIASVQNSSHLTWGGLPDGHLLGSPVPLFPRIEQTEPAS